MPKADAQGAAAASTKDALLAAAATAIARDGWTGATTRRVATLAGVNQGLVHYHFGSMADLRRQAAVRVLTQEVEGPMAALMAPGPIAEALVECLRLIGHVDPRSDASLVLLEAMLAATRDPEVGPLLRAALDAAREQLAARIAEAGGRQPDASATVIIAALDGLLLHRVVDADLDPVALAGPLLAALERAAPTPGGGRWMR